MGEAGFLSIRFVAFRYSSVHLEGQSRPDVGLKEPMTATNSTNTFIVGCVGPRFTTMHCLSVERDGANLLFVVWQGSVPNHRISSHLFLTILHNYQFRTNFAQFRIISYNFVQFRTNFALFRTNSHYFALFVHGFLRIHQEVKYIFCSAEENRSFTSFQLPEILDKLRANYAKLCVYRSVIIGHAPSQKGVFYSINAGLYCVLMTQNGLHTIF